MPSSSTVYQWYPQSMQWCMSWRRHLSLYSNKNVTASKQGGIVTVDALVNEWQIVVLALDDDAVEAFEDARFGSCSTSRERVEDDAALWCHEADEPAHERDGFDGRMCNAVDDRALGLRRLSVVKKP